MWKGSVQEFSFPIVRQKEHFQVPSEKKWSRYHHKTCWLGLVFMRIKTKSMYLDEGITVSPNNLLVSYSLMGFGCKSPNWRLHKCDSLQVFALLGWMFGVIHGSFKTPNWSYFFGWMLFFFFWGGEVTEQKWLTGFIYMDGWEKGHPLQDFNSSQWMALFNYLSEWATIVEGLKFESLQVGTWNDLVYDK